MGKVRISLSLIAAAFSVAMFLLSWGIYSYGLSPALLPDVARPFVTPVNGAIAAWNVFAAENGVKIVVADPIALEGSPSTAQSGGMLDDESEPALEDADTSSRESGDISNAESGVVLTDGAIAE